MLHDIRSALRQLRSAPEIIGVAPRDFEFPLIPRMQALRTE